MVLPIDDEIAMRAILDGQPVVFEPGVINILVAALEESWATLQTSGIQLDGDLANARELLALRIIETAKNGERDPSRLVRDAVDYFVNEILTSGIH
jgi:hypothetical protein